MTTSTSGVGSSNLLSSVTSYSDWAGRTYKQTRTAPHGQTAITTTSYNALGQAETITSSGQPSVKYLYNTEGEQIATWTDRNGDGQFNDTAVAGVKDSCTTTQRDYIPAASAPAPLGDSRRTISTVRTETDEDKIVSTSWQSVDGLRSRQETLGVANPTTATRTRPLDGASTTEQTRPDGTKVEAAANILANGNTQTTSTSYTSDSSPAVIETNVSIADAMGRTIQTTNGRGHVTEFSYHGAGGQINSITQVNAAPGGGNLIASNDYALAIGSGRLVTTTLPNQTFQYQETNLLGRTTRQWGSQLNPVSYTYDAAGRPVTLTTYQDPVSPTADTFPGNTFAATTAWRYDPSGALLGKRDAANQEVTYTYDIAGRVLTRTWVRGVVTTYGYLAGELTSTTYTNDPANTPSVVMSYDRLGRQTASSSLLSSVYYAYDPVTLALDTETVVIDPDGSGSLPSLTRVLDRSDDALDRQSGTAVSAVGSSTPEHFTNYGYDNTGRLSNVTSPAGTFTYSYLANSSLIASVTGPVHTVTNTWEPNRDVLDVKDNRIPSTSIPISRFDYQVNAINQRTQVQTTGSAFPSQPADWNWGYDPLGQVTSADSPDDDFDRAYTYDLIGNRKKSADGALVTTGASYTVYDANNLNQYSQISVPSVQSVVPIHDQDGNATSYPLPVAPATNAALAYDGENRLITVTTGSTTATYKYDSQSRRIARTEGDSTTLYLYDGWNCIAEYTLQDSSFKLQTSHTWGLDLSDSLQDAGGVGGLLSVTKHGAQSNEDFYCTYDGNGNVSEYLAGVGGVISHLDYDAFGNILSQTGIAPSDYAFSTKPLGRATGLYYYGYRYYDQLQGRWPTRDPISENGGINLYAFVTNQPITGVDYLGQLDVTTDLQAPEKAPVIWTDEGVSMVQKGVTKGEGSVDCDCVCPESQKTRRQYWFARCTVRTNFTIKLSLTALKQEALVAQLIGLNQYGQTFWHRWRGIYGHEMAHVKSRNYFVQKKIVEPLAGQPDKFTTDKACFRAIGKPMQEVDDQGRDRTPAANGYIQDYRRRMKEAFAGNNHKGAPGGGMVNNFSPTDGEMIFPPPGVNPPRPPGWPALTPAPTKAP